MGRKSKRAKVQGGSSSAVKRIEDSEDDLVYTPSTKSKKRTRIASDSDSDQDVVVRSGTEESRTPTPTKSSKKRKILAPLDSSDEENVDVNIRTPKHERIKKLQQMSKNVQAKKGLYVSSEDDAEDSDDEEDLPMFQHEEELPEEALKSENVNEDSDLEDFVVDDDVVEVEDESDEASDVGEEEEAVSTDSESDNNQRKSKRLQTQSRKLKTKKKTKKCKTRTEEEEDDEDEEEEDDYDYANPYVEMDDAMESSDIIDILSKNTAKDKKNAKLYKKEMGKYQFSVRSENNKAAKLSKKARFAINMDQVKTDRGFKVERNLDVKDDEFYNYVERTLFGERLRIFPHTKRYTRYNTRCALIGCGEKLRTGESRVIGATKFRFLFNFSFLSLIIL